MAKARGTLPCPALPARVRGHLRVRGFPRVGCVGARQWMSPGDHPWFPSEMQMEQGEAEGCPAGALRPDSWLCCSVSPAAPAPDGRSPLQGSGMAAAPIPDPCGSWLLPQHPPQSAGEVQRPSSASSLPSHRDSASPEPPGKLRALRSFVCSLSLPAGWVPKFLLSHF